MPITLPSRQLGGHVEPFARQVTKSGGRKVNAAHKAQGVTGGPGASVLVSHQMRYRQQKTSSVNEGADGKDTIDMQEFNSITDPLVDPGI